MTSMPVLIKEMVKDNKTVRFTHYRDGELWYITECGFEFPVPIDDAKGAIFLAEDKALLFMRWLRIQDRIITQAAAEAYFGEG